MTTYSVSMLAPVAATQDIQQIAAAMQWGPECLSVPLSSTGQEPATHMACHVWAGKSFVDMLAILGTGVLPEEIRGILPDIGLSESAALNALLEIDSNISINPAQNTGYSRFAEFCAAHNLKIVST